MYSPCHVFCNSVIWQSRSHSCKKQSSKDKSRKTDHKDKVRICPPSRLYSVTVDYRQLLPLHIHPKSWNHRYKGKLSLIHPSFPLYTIWIVYNPQKHTRFIWLKLIRIQISDSPHKHTSKRLATTKKIWYLSKRRWKDNFIKVKKFGPWAICPRIWSSYNARSDVDRSTFGV